MRPAYVRSYLALAGVVPGFGGVVDVSAAGASGHFGLDFLGTHFIPYTVHFVV